MIPDGFRRVTQLLASLQHPHAPVFLEEAFRPGAGLIVEVPVKTLRQVHALRCFQPEAVHVRNEHQQPCQRLLGRDAEFGCLLDRVGGVGAGVRQPDDCAFNRNDDKSVAGNG